MVNRKLDKRLINFDKRFDKKFSIKFQKAKLEFASHWQLFMYKHMCAYIHTHTHTCTHTGLHIYMCMVMVNRKSD